MSCESQSEVDEFLVLLQSAQLVKLFLQEVFHGLYVVVGHAFDVLDALSVGFREVAVDVSQGFEDTFVHALQLGQRQLAEGDEVLHFHPYAVSHQCEFREIGGQGIRLAPITTVNRRDCGK